MKILRILACSAAVLALVHATFASRTPPGTNWAAYNGSQMENHFSPLTQISPANVRRLRVAWTFHTGETGGIETNPLIVEGVLYGYTPSLQVVALDAANGRLIWKFDSGIRGTQPSRGFSWWSDGTHRILFAGVMNYLYALDPDTGKPIPAFGESGRIDLRKDLRGDYTKNVAVLTSPGIIYRDNIIVGFRAPETKPAPPGDIRAYDVHTGSLRWSFHTIPHPGEEGYDTWPKDAWKTAGAANNWAGMALDRRRGIVYVPTGSAVTDFYGYDRIGNDLYADTLLALDAKTGRKLWYFQTTHHDIWDRDPPSPPVLLTIQRNGKSVDAVAQTTKQGYVFVFDRVTGAPLFPVREEAFPQSTVPGEKTAPTQPVPQAPAPFARQSLTADMLTQRTAAAHSWAIEQFATFRSAGQYVPFSLNRQTVVVPGFDGGAEWGGAAVDPRNGVLYVNANDVAWTGGLRPRMVGGSAGGRLYQNQCSLCHGADRHGSPPSFPSLIGITKRLTDEQIESTVRSGRGRMPSFPNLRAEQISELLSYLRTDANPLHEASSTQVVAAGADSLGQQIYRTHCALCHGEDRMGAPSNYPGLIGVRQRLSDKQILDNVHHGKGRMPGFSDLTPQDDAALLRFLGPLAPLPTSVEKSELSSGGDAEAPYLFTGYRKFLDPDGYPAVAPPWGTLSAIDLNTGRYLWKVPLGDYPALAAQGLSHTGTENYGGPVVTASGLLFIGATIFDHSLRAFDVRSGKVLWTGNLPYAGVATPATYIVHGRQYVVIATSGQRDPNEPQGAAYVAFCLPSQDK